MFSGKRQRDLFPGRMDLPAFGESMAEGGKTMMPMWLFYPFNFVLMRQLHEPFVADLADSIILIELFIKLRHSSFRTIAF